MTTWANIRVNDIGTSIDWAMPRPVVSEDQLNKLLIGIHMLGGEICSSCGSVKLKGTKCYVCTMKKYL